MPDPLPELRVEIHKLGNQFMAVTKEGNGREVCTNRFEHNPTGLTYLGPLWLLERGMLNPSEMRKVGPSLIGRGSRGQVAQYGKRLYEYLFGNGRALHKFVRGNSAYTEGQLALAIHADAASLWRLPWEYMHDSTDFVCLNGQMQLKRVLEAVTPLTPAPFPLPLRTLIVIASPHDQEPLDVERELDVMMETLDEVVNTGLIQMDILNDATLPALQHALTQNTYHVLHYIGHGKYSNNQKGFLCFQNVAGNTEPVTARHLKSHLKAAPSLRLVALSACQSAQIGVLDAFDNVAAGLLQAGLPAVLAVPTSLQDESAIALARALYTALAEGATVIESVYHARQALYDVDNLRAGGQRRFDWGVPALYARTTNLRLVDATLSPVVPTISTPDTLQEIGGLVVPSVFVGRQDALQTLRGALRNSVKTLYLWGAAGIGKSTLTARLLTQLDVEADPMLVIRCQEHPYPLTAIAAVAEFWREHAGEAGHQAATLLLDARQAPATRARRALQILAQRRDVLVFDNFDTWFVADDTASYPNGTTTVRDMSVARHLEDETLRALLMGLCSTHADTTLLFTARQRWAGLKSLPLNARFEFQVPLLKPNHAILLMNALPRLGLESLENKQAILRHIGGHPHALRLLDGWLDGAYCLQDFLDAPEAHERVAESWQYYFLDALLARLDPGEYDALCTLAIWAAAFCADTLANITAVQSVYAPALLQSWESVALISPFRRAVATESENHWYTLHPTVQEFILTRTSLDAAQDLHTQIATYYGAPFVEEAHHQITTRAATPWSEERVQWLARSASGVLGLRVRQTQDFTVAREAMQRALAWAYHLLAAGEGDAAIEIIKTLTPVLERTGQSELAKTLLYRAVEALEGLPQAESLNDLARLSLSMGHLDEAMRVYRSVYETLSEANARPQMAHILSRMAGIQQRQGELDAAIEKYQAAMALMHEVGDKIGTQTCLRELSRLYRLTQQFDLALKHSEGLKIMYQQQKNLAGLVVITYEQGLTFKALRKWHEALESFHKSMTMARRLGDKLQMAANLEAIADVLQKNHQTDEAVKVLQQALSLYRELGNQWGRVVAILELLGQLYERYGQAMQSQLIYARAQKVRERHQLT